MVMNAQNTMAQAQNLCFFIETIPPSKSVVRTAACDTACAFIHVIFVKSSIKKLSYIDYPK